MNKKYQIVITFNDNVGKQLSTLKETHIRVYSVYDHYRRDGCLVMFTTKDLDRKTVVPFNNVIEIKVGKK